MSNTEAHALLAKLVCN